MKKIVSALIFASFLFVSPVNAAEVDPFLQLYETLLKKDIVRWKKAANVSFRIIEPNGQTIPNERFDKLVSSLKLDGFGMHRLDLDSA